MKGGGRGWARWRLLGNSRAEPGRGVDQHGEASEGFRQISEPSFRLGDCVGSMAQ
jgi:hypothetical protein